MKISVKDSRLLWNLQGFKAIRRRHVRMLGDLAISGKRGPSPWNSSGSTLGGHSGRLPLEIERILDFSLVV